MAKPTTAKTRKLRADEVRTGETYDLTGEIIRVTHVEVNLSHPRRTQVHFETKSAKGATGRKPGDTATWGIVNFVTVAKLHAEA